MVSWWRRLWLALWCTSTKWDHALTQSKWTHTIFIPAVSSTSTKMIFLLTSCLEKFSRAEENMRNFLLEHFTTAKSRLKISILSIFGHVFRFWWRCGDRDRTFGEIFLIRGVRSRNIPVKSCLRGFVRHYALNSPYSYATVCTAFGIETW